MGAQGLREQGPGPAQARSLLPCPLASSKLPAQQELLTGGADLATHKVEGGFGGMSRGTEGGRSPTWWVKVAQEGFPEAGSRLGRGWRCCGRQCPVGLEGRVDIGPGGR